MKPSKHKKNTEILYCTGYYTAKAFMTLKSSLKFKVHPTAFKLQVPSVKFKIKEDLLKVSRCLNLLFRKNGFGFFT